MKNRKEWWKKKSGIFPDHTDRFTDGRDQFKSRCDRKKSDRERGSIIQSGTGIYGNRVSVLHIRFIRKNIGYGSEKPPGKYNRRRYGGNFVFLCRCDRQ